MLGKYIPCLNCKQEQYVPPYRHETFKFCSRKCGWEWQNKNDRVDVTCVICSKKFDVVKNRKDTAKYCSRSCYYKGQIGKGLTTYKCQHCNKEFLDSASKKRKFCSKSCTKKSSHETFKPSFTTVRKAMITRNLLVKCEKCGWDEYPQILGVHHKDRDRNNNSMENLEVLCPNCHSIEHMKHTPHAQKQ